MKLKDKLQNGVETDKEKPKWCTCDDPKFNGDYINAACFNCKSKIE